MTKYILGILDEGECEQEKLEPLQRAASRAADAHMELTWKETAEAIDRFRLAVHHVFGFEEKAVAPVYIKNPSLPLEDAAFDCKGYSYEVSDCELTCTGKVGM